jgi:hypothetical protein
VSGTGGGVVGGAAAATRAADGDADAEADADVDALPRHIIEPLNWAATHSVACIVGRCIGAGRARWTAGRGGGGGGRVEDDDDRGARRRRAMPLSLVVVGLPLLAVWQEERVIVVVSVSTLNAGGRGVWGMFFWAA